MTSRKGMRYEKDGQCRDNKNGSCFFFRGGKISRQCKCTLYIKLLSLKMSLFVYYNLYAFICWYFSYLCIFVHTDVNQERS